MTTQEAIPIYDGKPEDFTWFGFGSGSGTNLRECAKVIPPAGILSDRPGAKLFGLEELARAEHIKLNGFRFCGSWKKAQGDPTLEAEYREKSLAFNEQILERLQAFEEENGKIDLIVLGGYMRLVMDPLLEAYEDRIINVHPADLSILNEDNTRRFIGGDAVYDALKATQYATRSSVIMVDGQEDHGEILVQGPAVQTWFEFLHGTPAERAEALREYADGHQSLQKVRSDWPALTTALKLISEGKVALGTNREFNNEWRRVYIEGKPVEYEGFQVTT